MTSLFIFYWLFAGIVCFGETPPEKSIAKWEIAILLISHLIFGGLTLPLMIGIKLRD